jgi:hypothetical protein
MADPGTTLGEQSPEGHLRRDLSFGGRAIPIIVLPPNGLSPVELAAALGVPFYGEINT